MMRTWHPQSDGIRQGSPPITAEAQNLSVSLRLSLPLSISPRCSNAIVWRTLFGGGGGIDFEQISFLLCVRRPTNALQFESASRPTRQALDRRGSLWRICLICRPPTLSLPLSSSLSLPLPLSPPPPPRLPYLWYMHQNNQQRHSPHFVRCSDHRDAVHPLCFAPLPTQLWSVSAALVTGYAACDPCGCEPHRPVLQFPLSSKWVLTYWLTYEQRALNFVWEQSSALWRDFRPTGCRRTLWSLFILSLACHEAARPRHESRKLKNSNASL